MCDRSRIEGLKYSPLSLHASIWDESNWTMLRVRTIFFFNCTRSTEGATTPHYSGLVVGTSTGTSPLVCADLQDSNKRRTAILMSTSYDFKCLHSLKSLARNVARGINCIGTYRRGAADAVKAFFFSSAFFSSLWSCSRHSLNCELMFSSFYKTI